MDSKVRKPKMGGCFFGLFFGIFAAAGTAFFWFLAAAPIYHIVLARDWVEVRCWILSSEVAVSQGDDGSTYRVAITYGYDFGGATYQGERYDFSMGSSSGYDGKARVVARYPADEETVCYVDPERPTESVINRSPGAYLWWGLFPLPFMLIGYGGLLWFLLGSSGGPRRKARMAARACRAIPPARPRRRRPPSGSSQSTDAY